MEEYLTEKETVLLEEDVYPDEGIEAVTLADFSVPTISNLEELSRLTSDLQKAVKLLPSDQVRFLVDMYYSLQRYRIGTDAQVRSTGREPNDFLLYMGMVYSSLEKVAQSALGLYAQSKVPGQWAMSIKGIGPVISAGLLAHIDIEQTPSCGALMSFSGSNPAQKWLGRALSLEIIEKVLGAGKSTDILTLEQIAMVAVAAGRRAANLFRLASKDGIVTRGSLHASLAKRPWNPSLKVLRWKIGQGIMRVCNREGAFYGPYYIQRKLYELEQNEKGMYAEQARIALTTKRYRDETKAKEYYEQGKLPPAHIQARAERWTAKFTLSHLYEVMYEHHYQEECRKPWIISIGGHQDYVPPPNWDSANFGLLIPVAETRLKIQQKQEEISTVSPERAAIWQEQKVRNAKEKPLSLSTTEKKSAIASKFEKHKEKVKKSLAKKNTKEETAEEE